MTRGLPISILIHVLTLGLVLVFGNSVNQRQYEVPRTIGVQLVELPKREQPKVDKVEPVKVAEAPKPKPKIQENLPPKELPKPKADPKPKPDPPKEIIPEKEPEREEIRDVDDSMVEDADSDSQVVEALPPGASVSETDSDFPYPWYLTLMEGQIARNWDPKQSGFRNSGISCVVHFNIQRGGAVTQVNLTRSSGIGVFDRDAMRAIQSIRLAPLPAEFGSNTIGMTMTFNLESDDR